MEVFASTNHTGVRLDRLLPAQRFEAQVQSVVERLVHPSSAISLYKIGEARGTERQLPIYRITSGPLDGSKPIVLLTAGIHGDEPAGVHALLTFVQRDLPRYADRASFVIYPCLNPGGFDRCTRRNPEWIDLNRTFASEENSVPHETTVLLSDIKGLKFTASLHIDLHEDRRSISADVSRGATPTEGLYGYETATPGSEFAAQVLKRSGFPITQSPDAYGDSLRGGVAYSATSSQDSIFCKYQDLEGALFHRLAVTRHAITFETDGDGPLAQRTEQHLALLCGALDEHLNRLTQVAPQRGDTPVHGAAPILGCRRVIGAEGVEYLASAASITRPTVGSFYELLQAAVGRCGEAEYVKLCTVDYESRAGTMHFDHVIIRSKDIRSEDPVVVVRAGIHGREVDTSLALLHRLEEMFEYAHARGVKLIVFPLDNPSGYETMNYRNVEDTERKSHERSDWTGNNLGVVYLTRDGREIESFQEGVIDPQTGKPFDVVGVRDIRAAQARYFIPKESLVTLEAIDQFVPMSQVRGFLDLHQDCFGVEPFTYQFGFGNENQQYAQILKHLPLGMRRLTNHDNENHPFALEGYQESAFAVGSGGAARNPDSAIIEGLPSTATVEPQPKDAAAEIRQVSDHQGFIVCEDGSLPCLFRWSGVPHVATIEVSSVCTLDQSEQLFLRWIRGFVDLAAESPHPNRDHELG